MSEVRCFREEHGKVAHVESSDCLWPHEVVVPDFVPSMSAVETLDPREAVVNR